jgi:hypothetical protein
MSQPRDDRQEVRMACATRTAAVDDAADDRAIVKHMHNLSDEVLCDR